MKVNKTNAARLLDRAEIAYDLIQYVVDESDLSAAHLADSLGENPDRIFKTLVLEGDKSGFFVCLVPGGRELDLKKASRASGNKKCSMIAVKDLQKVTGYIRGGCSPIAMKKHFLTCVHESVQEWESVFVSAGLRGLQLRLTPDALLKATEGLLADLIAEDK